MLFRSKNLRELDFLNRVTGGHAISLEGIKKLLTVKSRVYHIVDLGCGSGDLMRFVAEWAKKEGFKIQLTGVDKNADAIRYLKLKSSTFPEIQYFTGDYREFLNHSRVDIFHCALFCHHLTDEELVELLRHMNTAAELGFVINDLQRNRFAYYGAKMMTTILGGSSLSKHDGPVSVLRGFNKKELKLILKEAGVANYHVLHRPFFRLLAIGRNGATQGGYTT